jgi:hypothetical protein
MSYLPELRASLVRAAERQRETEPSGRRRRGWLGPVVAVGVAIAVAAVAIVLVGHGRGSAGPAGGGTPALHSNGAGPSQMPNLPRPEWSLINKARRATVKDDPACSPFVGARPGLRPGQPSRKLTAILGVLRRPAGAADRVPLKLFQHGPFDVYVSSIRLARERDGVAMYVAPTANVLGLRPVPPRCASEEGAALGREMKGASAKQRTAALDGQSRYLAWQQYEAERPQGVCLVEVNSAPGRGSGAFAGGSVACGWDVAEIEQGLAGLGQTDSPGPSFFHGIVPDGVASVVLELPDDRGTVTARVINNVYLAPVARSVRAPARVIWRAADGSVIRTTRVP